jgi:hypothetical protein
MKASLLRKIGTFDPQYRITDDYDLWLRASLSTPFAVISEPLCEKIAYETSPSRDLIATLRDHQEVIKNFVVKNRTAIVQLGLRNAFQENVAKTFYDIGNQLYEQNELGQAFDHFVNGLKCSATPNNGVAFFWTISKKLLRTLSSGLISRQRLTGRPQ